MIRWGIDTYFFGHLKQSVVLYQIFWVVGRGKRIFGLIIVAWIWFGWPIIAQNITKYWFSIFEYFLWEVDLEVIKNTGGFVSPSCTKNKTHGRPIGTVSPSKQINLCTESMFGTKLTVSSFTGRLRIRLCGVHVWRCREGDWPMNMDDMSVSENGQFCGRFKGGHDDQASKLGILMDFGHLGFETGAWTPQFYLFRIGKIIINYGICCFPQMFRYILMCSLAQQNHFSPTQGEMVGVSS